MLPVKEIYRKKHGVEGDLPDVYKNLLQYTKDRWNFSFDFQKETQSTDESAVQNGIKQSVDAIKSLKEDRLKQHDWAR